MVLLGGVALLQLLLLLLCVSLIASLVRVDLRNGGSPTCGAGACSFALPFPLLVFVPLSVSFAFGGEGRTDGSPGFANICESSIKIKNKK